ncbi:uncharacterized protein M421DRAFT_368773 [Didymella exigua CBS 183.55]|uniref:Uncharacterized protein n=1 Tax=Didymella exigua CBS 183.55 TaxID=1150837 RepID=A0A6A5R5Q0_9PLEO|nr:uncharacterized protein M421DRAFT_368773 [Didymella exigua CBS 183.55]KAF1922334.1 hypothetical protein M421DRAFT_368773 [Didymella exigua CBS 183.55]
MACPRAGCSLSLFLGIRINSVFRGTESIWIIFLYRIECIETGCDGWGISGFTRPSSAYSREYRPKCFLLPNSVDNYFHDHHSCCQASDTVHKTRTHRN